MSLKKNYFTLCHCFFAERCERERKPAEFSCISDLCCCVFMSLTIQTISPSDVRRYLIRQPFGTFIIRHSTNNDEITYMIRCDNSNKFELPKQPFLVLSIRVDGTIYEYDIENCILPYNQADSRGDNKHLLEPYNRLRKTNKNRKFTPLKDEFIVPQDVNRWLLNKKYFQDIDFEAKINNGKHSQGISSALWQCDKQHDIRVFIKRFNKKDYFFANEFSLHKDLCYFSIVSFFGYFSDDRYNYLVFEDGGQSLESLCPLHFRSNTYKMRFIVTIGFQIVQAMMYLEKKNIVHRDLTAGNVVINSKGYVKIVDFGHAMKKEEGKNSLERSLTSTGVKRFQYRFLAPECLPSQRSRLVTNQAVTTNFLSDIYASFSSKSDVWSFGILLIQLMIKDPQTPYPFIKNTDDIPQYVKIERKIHPKPDGCPTDLYLVLQRCWAYDPISRISFTELREKLLKLEAILK